VHLASYAPAIRYTLDGTPPTALSPVYEDAVELTKPGLYDLRYVAQGEDGTMSKVVLGQLYEVR